MPSLTDFMITLLKLPHIDNTIQKLFKQDSVVWPWKFRSGPEDNMRYWSQLTAPGAKQLWTLFWLVADQEMLKWMKEGMDTRPLPPSATVFSIRLVSGETKGEWYTDPVEGDLMISLDEWSETVHAMFYYDPFSAFYEQSLMWKTENRPACQSISEKPTSGKKIQLLIHQIEGKLVEDIIQSPCTPPYYCSPTTTTCHNHNEVPFPCRLRHCLLFKSHLTVGAFSYRPFWPPPSQGVDPFDIEVLEVRTFMG
jgi:hypothetical protein